MRRASYLGPIPTGPSTRVRDCPALSDHADLPARPHRVNPLHAVLAGRDLLELAQALHVLLQGISAGARPGPRKGIRRLHDHRLHRSRLDLVVMGLHRMRYGLWLAVALSDARAHLGVRALDLVAHGFADVVKKRGPARRLDRSAQFGCDQAGKLRALDEVVKNV